MNYKLKYFITLLSTTVLGNQALNAEPSDIPQNNDSFLGKLGPSNHTAPGVFHFSQSHYHIDENSTKAAKITVNRSHCSSGSPPVSLSYATTQGTAQKGSDYQPVKGRLSWGAMAKGDCFPRQFEIPVMDDIALEGNETVNLNLSAPFGGAVIGESEAVLTIVDDDIQGHEGSIIAFPATPLTVSEEAGFATVTVHRTACHHSLPLPASVSYHTTNASGESTGTASVGHDYKGVNGVLSWGIDPAENCGPRHFRVPIVDDSVVENDKTVQVHLSHVKGAQLGQSEATLTIIDNDINSGPGVLSFSRSHYRVTEGLPLATITVNRTDCGPGSPPVSVSYGCHHGTATQLDSQTVTGTLTWEAIGDCRPQQFEIPIKDDSVSEKSETLNIQLSQATDGASISEGKATLTISDNDFTKAPPIARDNPGTFSFSRTHYPVQEQNSTATILVNRTSCGPDSPPATVTITTSKGTATAHHDYTPLNATLHWGTTLTEQFNGDCEPWYVSIPIRDDTTFENSETIGLHLSEPTVTPLCQSSHTQTAESRLSNGARFFESDTGLANPCTPGEAQLGIDSAILTIIDNDGSQLGFSEAQYQVNENAQKAQITLTRQGIGCKADAIPLPPASVSYSTHQPSTAASGSDYVATSGTLRWGDTASGNHCGPRQFEIPILDDPLFEEPETIQLKLSTANGASNRQSQARLTIIDNETTGTGPGGFSFSQARYQVIENKGFTTLTVNRTECGDTSPVVSVSYHSSPSTATSMEDYQSVSGTLTWADSPYGDCRPRSFNLSIKDDNEFEGLETVNLTLSNPTGGANIGQSQASVTILDNEPEPTENNETVNRPSPAENTARRANQVNTGKPQAQVQFINLQPHYLIGNTRQAPAVIKLQVSHLETVDLWIAVQMANTGPLYFMTNKAQAPFSLTPQAYQRALSAGNQTYELFTFPSSPPIGQYTFYALLVEPGHNPLESGEEVYRSNLVIRETECLIPK
ncbi:MAG: Calx-beta domain-containing protein [Candidatus Parabeggiatoa sp.]|nr:Calx-beta domain-containing protein [Candidatus Parabeggiatoa sp.]